MPRYDLYFNDILRAVELIEKSVSNISMRNSSLIRI